MNSCENVIIAINGSEEILCPNSLVKKSKLLVDMIAFSDNTSDIIKLPQFITNNVISEMLKLLKTMSLAYLSNYSVEDLLLLFKTSDFLEISEFTEALLNIIVKKISSENCFEVFKLSRTSACFSTISAISLEKIIQVLSDYYVKLPLTATHNDPYYEKYKLLSVMDIRFLISAMTSSLTVCKILLFQNWLRANNDTNIGEVKDILTMINDDATYIPKSQIQHMRKIRDKIIAQLS